MTYEMLGTPSMSALRASCDPFDLPSNASPNGFNNYNSNNYGTNNANNGNFPFKPLAMSFNPSPPIRPHLSMTEQAELEFELRYRGNMIVDQQRRIQQLEEELKRTRDQMDMMNNQLTSYEQERLKDKKKPQSRYWTPDEHQRFLEALNKYGHKDVKAISSHVSTRNATQVRTHAQKYFLRLERERRKKGEEDGNGAVHDGYNSSGEDQYNSDQSLSPVEDLSPINHSGVASPPQISGLPASQPQAIPQNNNLVALQRRRSGSLITPSMGKLALQHQSAVLAEMPTWTVEDYEQFVKGLLAVVDRQEDFVQVCRNIRDGYLPHQSVDDVENCYRNVHKFLKQKPVALLTPVGSPKRRRTSKPELPINLQANIEGPLPGLGVPPLMNNSSSPSSFGFSLSGSPLPPPPQYMNTNSINTNGGNNNNSTVSLLPFQPPVSNMNMNMNMRPLFDYGMPSMASLQISNIGMNNMGMMDVNSANNSSHPWNSLALSFDLHQNTPSSSLNLPQGTPLVSSHN